MALFVGTLIITFVCGAALGLGLILAGKPLAGGCGKRIPGKVSCHSCPNKMKKRFCRHNQRGVRES